MHDNECSIEDPLVSHRLKTASTMSECHSNFATLRSHSSIDFTVGEGVEAPKNDVSSTYELVLHLLYIR